MGIRGQFAVHRLSPEFFDGIVQIWRRLWRVGLVNQFHKAGVLGSGKAQERLIEGSQFAVVVFRKAQQIGVSDLFRPVHAMLKGSCGFEDVNWRGPEEMARQPCELEQKRAGISERVLLANQRWSAGDAKKTSLREGAGSECFLGSGIEPGSGLGLFGV